jgi:hypothetical protein
VLEVFDQLEVELEVQLQLQVSTSTSTPMGEMVRGDLIELNVLYKSVSDKLCSILHSSGDTGRGPLRTARGPNRGPKGLYNVGLT